MNKNIVEINAENAQEYLIDESMTRPVLIDFWADWCAPCKVLLPLLEKLADEYSGSFLLAKVNADDQQMIASQFGVRSLPTVMLMKDGQVADGFTGAKTETEVRELLDKYLPKAWDIQLSQAREFIASGSYADALPLLQQAYRDSGARADIAFAYSDVLIHSKRYTEAEDILKSIRLADQDTQYEQLLAQLELAQQARRSPEIEDLEKQYKASSEDLGLAYRLAIKYSQDQFHQEALALLHMILLKDRNYSDGGVKKTFLDILAVLGKGDPTAVKYQRKLYTLLY